MKNSKKFLVIFIYSFILFISQINYGICSDNASANQQTGQYQQQVSNAEIPEQPSTQGITQQSQQTPPSSDIHTDSETKVNQGFIPALMNMIMTLLKVIFSIIAIAGIIILYRRIKSKTPADREIKNQKTSDVENKEPTTVTEAVSSFVRHKVKNIS